MKKFRYNMENLLQVKIKLEDQAKIAYGNARLIKTREDEKLNLLESKKVSYVDEQRELRQAKLNLLKIKNSEEAVRFIEERIKQQQMVVRSAAQRLEVARIRLNNAMVERKTQDKLKEKAWENYLMEFEAEERKEIDELNSFQYSNPRQIEEDI